MKMSRIAAGLMLSLAAAGAHAALLSDLLSGGSILAGDKLFDSWKLVSYTSSDVNRSFNASNIDVQALSDGGDKPGPGLRFTASRNELGVTGDGVFGFVDLMFGFRVSVLDPARRVSGNALSYAPAGAMLSWTVDGSYDLGTYIREVIGTAEGLDDLGQKNIEFSQLGDPQSGSSATAKISDSAAFAPQQSAWVTKNILVWAVDPTDTAVLTQFDQRFSQSQVPEPGSFALLGLGLLGLGWGRQTARKNNLAIIG